MEPLELLPIVRPEVPLSVGVEAALGDGAVDVLASPLPVVFPVPAAALPDTGPEGDVLEPAPPVTEPGFGTPPAPPPG